MDIGVVANGPPPQMPGLLPVRLNSRTLAGPRTVGPKVLLIEDDLDISTLYERMLREAGYQLVLAHDGISGLRAMVESAPNLVLLDLHLPGIDGIEVLKQMASDGRLRHLKVLVLSNFSEPSTIAECRRLGARDYVVKSNVTPRELAQIIAIQLLD